MTENETEIQTQEQKPNMIMDAHSAAEKLKAENERMEKNIKQLQDLRAEQILSGTSNGNQEPPKPQEESNQDYFKRVMSGGLNGPRKEE